MPRADYEHKIPFSRSHALSPLLFSTTFSPLGVPTLSHLQLPHYISIVFSSQQPVPFEVLTHKKWRPYFCWGGGLCFNWGFQPFNWQWLIFKREISGSVTVPGGGGRFWARNSWLVASNHTTRSALSGTYQNLIFFSHADMKSRVSCHLLTLYKVSSPQMAAFHIIYLFPKD